MDRLGRASRPRIGSVQAATDHAKQTHVEVAEHRFPNRRLSAQGPAQAAGATETEVGSFASIQNLDSNKNMDVYVNTNINISVCVWT